MKRLLIVAVAALLALSCGGGGGGGGKADLQVWFEPNPVERSADAKWYFLVSIEDASGIGVTITGFRIDEYTLAGEYLHRLSYPVETFVEWFHACGGHGAYLEDRLRRCAHIVYSGEPTSCVWTFSGIDDRGNAVSSSAELRLVEPGGRGLGTGSPQPQGGFIGEWMPSER